MKYSLISDLHLDFGGWNWRDQQLEDIVVVAGDTTNGLAGLKFLHKLEAAGHTIISVDGNHEHYSNRVKRRTIIETETRFQEDFAYLHGIDDVYFIQTNGWYYVQDERLWNSYMNDYLCGSGNEVNEAADSSVFFLWCQLSYLKQMDHKAVITTHTAPSLDTLNSKFEGHFSNEWFFSPRLGELRKEFQDVILVWNHGHSHAPADKIVDGVRTVCNPRGYPGENPLWKPLTIEV